MAEESAKSRFHREYEEMQGTRKERAWDNRSQERKEREFVDRETGEAAGAIVNLVGPRVTGNAKVGQTLTLENGDWQPSGLTFARQWIVGGGPVAETGTTYTVQAGDVGKSVDVQVTASKDGYTNYVARTPATVAVVA